jgi:hypothetical protein
VACPNFADFGYFRLLTPFEKNISQVNASIKSFGEITQFVTCRIHVPMLFRQNFFKLCYFAKTFLKSVNFFFKKFFKKIHGANFSGTGQLRIF